MERLLVEAVVCGVLAPLLHRYLLGGRPTVIWWSFVYALGTLVFSWVSAELGLGRIVAILSLTQVLILGGIIFFSSAATIKILERLRLIGAE